MNYTYLESAPPKKKKKKRKKRTELNRFIRQRSYAYHTHIPTTNTHTRMHRPSPKVNHPHSQIYAIKYGLKLCVSISVQYVAAPRNLASTWQMIPCFGLGAKTKSQITFLVVWPVTITLNQLS